MLSKEKKLVFLLKMANKYIWWKTPDDAIKYPLHIILQTMKLGVYEDIQELKHTFGNDKLARAVIESEIGALSSRALSYWICVLNLPKETRQKVRLHT